MKQGVRLGLLAVLLAAGSALVVALYLERVNSPLASTLTSAWQVVGAPVKLLDRMASRVVPVGALDEKDLGDVLHARYAAQIRAGDADQAYLDGVIAQVQPFAHKPFRYRAYVIDAPAPNAMALPGGPILVTRPLLSTLRSEAELAAVLAHETGHIERGHCFDAVRFQLLTRKIGSDTLGALADFATQVLLRHAYSKTTEADADDYSWEWLQVSRYDPMAEGRAFGSLRAYLAREGLPAPQHAEPIRDYFTSHPPLEIREAEYVGRASAWWGRHADERRYVGRRNLAERKAFTSLDAPEEWTTGAAANAP